MIAETWYHRDAMPILSNIQVERFASWTQLLRGHALMISRYHPDESPRESALKIWKAGVAAVNSERLVQQAIHINGDVIDICGETFSATRFRRIVVVGGGKASAGMTVGLEAALGPELLSRTTGWVNIPADCMRPTARVRLHPARPAGANEPTEAGVRGVREILTLMAGLEESTLCLVLLSGGASALLPGPKPGISLDDKLQITRLLMRSGACIEELNAVRSRLSIIKGGGLARAAGGGVVRSLIISDVVGDPLDVIASGPTHVAKSNRALLDPVEIINRLVADQSQVPESVRQELARPQPPQGPVQANVDNHIIGNNATAVAAARAYALQAGFHVIDLGAEGRGEAAAVGVDLATRCRAAESMNRAVCLISGGEPIVDLKNCSKPGKGGRNQELAVAALESRWEDDIAGFCLISGGTDGEDGPTDAAGGIADDTTRRGAKMLGLHPRQFLERHDCYNFLEPCGGLLKTGPTHTNVMDLRVGIVMPRTDGRS